MFDGAFDLKYGVAGVCVLLTLFILLEVFKFLWSLREKKDSVSDRELSKLTAAMKEATASIKHLELSMGELQKLKIDIRRFYTAVKAIAGPKWPEIRDEILAEDEIKP